MYVVFGMLYCDGSDGYGVMEFLGALFLGWIEKEVEKGIFIFGIGESGKRSFLYSFGGKQVCNKPAAFIL